MEPELVLVPAGQWYESIWLILDQTGANQHRNEGTNQGGKKRERGERWGRDKEREEKLVMATGGSKSLQGSHPLLGP